MKLDSFLTVLGLKNEPKDKLDYQTWIDKVESISYQGRGADNGSKASTLSIILVASTDLNNDLIKDSITSTLNQTASNWELLIVTSDDARDNSVLKDQRIRVFHVNKDTAFFDSVNLASKSSSGDFITFIREGDRLSEYAVMRLNGCLSDNPSLQLIVTDEDFLDASGQRCNPFFKPDWNPDYLSNYNYFSQAVFYSRKLFGDLGDFNCKESDPYHSLALKASHSLENKQFSHIDKVLFHFKKGIVDKTNRVQFGIPKPAPLVTVIIPTKDHMELLKPCLDGLLNNTTYENFEIIVIDNQSEQTETLDYLKELTSRPQISVLNYDKPFNYSEMNNLAVIEAKGSLLCFLNNDISVINSDWLSEMVSQACRPEIGCVGAKLFYPDGTIQHAGVILGLKGYASHAHKGFAGDDPGYFNRLIVTHNVSAVTAACMVLRKDVFEEVGGLDTENLKVAYNDVDLCLKVREAGYRNLFTPHAQLIHHESKSRGTKRNKKQQKQLREESAYLLKKWGGCLYSDPAYNKNLTLLREDFSLGMDRLKR